MVMQVRIRRVRESATLPTYATDGAAGLDLYTATHVTIGAGKIARVPLGVSMELAAGYVADVRPRSGLTLAGLLIQYGTCDSDFRGELCATVWNMTGADCVLVPGQRIAQLVVVSVPRVDLVEVDVLSDTVRGGGGYGSTGV